MPSAQSRPLGSVDPVPFAAVTWLREHVGEFRARPCLGIATLVDIVDPRARHHLLAVSKLLLSARLMRVANRSLFSEG